MSTYAPFAKPLYVMLKPRRGCMQPGMRLLLLSGEVQTVCKQSKTRDER